MLYSPDGRFGGEEFIAEEVIKKPEEIKGIMNKYLEKIRQTKNTGGKRVSISRGVVVNDELGNLNKDRSASKKKNSKDEQNKLSEVIEPANEPQYSFEWVVKRNPSTG